MSRTSRNDRYPSNTTWRGRPLPRPLEELEDQGLGFDVQTVLNRRSLLRGVGLGALGMGLAACSDGSTSSGSSSGTNAEASASDEIPQETAGPYPGDGSNGPDVLEESGVVRSDIRSSVGDASATAEGVPMTLELALSDLADGGSAFAGAAVYVWHCDREGRYSMYSEGAEDQNYLRGAQIADDDGIVSFRSIFPACYSGRWPHIHFEVYPDRQSITDSASAIATSQVALPKAACDKVFATTGYEQSVANMRGMRLSTDNVFSDDGGASQLATATGNVDDGYTVKLAVRIDTSTKPQGEGAPGRGAGPSDGGNPPEAPGSPT